jgi:hypothetical protein
VFGPGSHVGGPPASSRFRDIGVESVSHRGTGAGEGWLAVGYEAVRERERLGAPQFPVGQRRRRQESPRRWTHSPPILSALPLCEIAFFLLCCLCGLGVKKFSWKGEKTRTREGGYTVHSAVKQLDVFATDPNRPVEFRDVVARSLAGLRENERKTPNEALQAMGASALSLTR